uniref:Uncharacterized protein n=1 Tax=Anguilla anguilla TaxID=7936 RepID=A0A0E9T3R2_ANGAN
MRKVSVQFYVVKDSSLLVRLKWKEWCRQVDSDW